MTGKHIGDLGIERPALDLEFGYFGLVLRVNPDATDLDLVEFLMTADSIDQLDEVKGTIAIGRYLRALVHPEDWDVFWSTAKGNRQNLTDLMLTTHAIIAAVAAFPTGQPSDSSTGPSSTGRRLKGGYSSAGPARRDTTRALTLLKGRPDLQSAVLRAAEAVEAAG